MNLFGVCVALACGLLQAETDGTSSETCSMGGDSTDSMGSISLQHATVLKQLQLDESDSEFVSSGLAFWQFMARLRKELAIIYGAHPIGMLKKDFTTVVGTLMPGSQPRLEKKLFEFMLVAASLLWLLFYNFKIYEPDRGEGMDRWRCLEKEGGTKIGVDAMQPDLVLVFHHPDSKLEARRKRAVTKQTLRRALFSWWADGSACDEEHFVRTMSLCGPCVRRHSSAGDQEFVHTRSLCDEERSPNLAEVQVKLLQDVYMSLTAMGFDMDVFTSLGGDELMVCVSLHDEETIRQQLQRSRARLQLQPWVVSRRLGIDQPAEAESSPPYVEYSSSLAKNTLGDGKTDFELFKVFGQQATKTSRGTILAGEKRIKHVYRYLNARLNLDFAVSQGLLAQWFPAHSPIRISDLKTSWGRWGLLLDFSFVQPMTVLNNYLGSRVAFIFAWNGHYCKLLLALLPVALFFASINVLAVDVGPNPYWNRGSAMGFSMIVAVWGKWAQNSWDREQQYLATLWDLNEAEKDRSQRADFRGTAEPSHVDRNITELNYDNKRKTFRMSVSWLITISFCCLDFLFIVTWLNLWEGKMSQAAMVVHALIVQVFTQVFNSLAQVLTEAENHKFQGQYYDSYLAKNFMFQFVNQYMGFFFVAIKQQYTSVGCEEHDCIGMLRTHLQTMLVTLAIMQATMVVLATVEVERRLWFERRKLRLSTGEVPEYCYVEKQSKFGTFRIREQIEMMVKLALTLGYVLIFGAVAPRIVPLALMVFAVQLRGGAVLLTTAAKRPVPRLAKGIGAWQGIMNVLSIVGILFSAYLFVQFGPVFSKTEVLTKVSGMSLYVCFLFTLRVVVDWIAPSHSEQADTIIVRRDYVTKKLMEAQEHSTAVPVAQDERIERTAPYSAEVANGDWSSIPRARQMADPAA